MHNYYFPSLDSSLTGVPVGPRPLTPAPVLTATPSLHPGASFIKNLYSIQVSLLSKTFTSPRCVSYQEPLLLPGAYFIKNLHSTQVRLLSKTFTPPRCVFYQEPSLHPGVSLIKILHSTQVRLLSRKTKHFFLEIPYGQSVTLTASHGF